MFTEVTTLYGLFHYCCLWCVTPWNLGEVYRRFGSTVLYACGTLVLSYRRGWGWVQMCSGTGTILFGLQDSIFAVTYTCPPSSDQRCNYFHPVTAAVSLLPQWEISVHYPPSRVPLDTICITLELLVASYRTNQSPQHAREGKIVYLKIRKKRNDKINQTATKIIYDEGSQ